MTPIVIDLEWNHPVMGKVPIAGIPNEIIQIGAAKIDMSAEVTDTFSELIRPFYYPKLNKDVAELTLITSEDLQAARPFPEVLPRNWSPM